MQSWIYLIYGLPKVLSTATASEEGVGTVQATVRLPVRAIRDRKPVPELRDRGLRAARCLYTDVFRREASRTGILRPSLASM